MTGNEHTVQHHRGNLTGLDHNFRMVDADIADLNAMLRIFRQEEVEAVVNFAAESHNDRAIDDPTPFARSNAFGAQQILEASRRCGVRRHVHISTIEVYGEQDEATPYFTETSPLNAKTPYSAAKAAGDLLVRSYMQTYEEAEPGVRDGELPIYDISARCEVPNRRIAELLVGFLGKTYDACVEHVADRPNHDRRYLIEPKKIEERLGFAPVVDFEAGLEETVKWYVDHPQWWEGILAGNAKLVFDWSGSRK